VASGSQVSLKVTEQVAFKQSLTLEGNASLEIVVDPSAGEDNYLYDAIGNLIEDKQEGTTIDWNVYGKVSQVRKADGTVLSFRYDAAGNRVEKQVISPFGGRGAITRYLRDASGNVMGMYRQEGSGEESLPEQPIYGSSRLGLYRGGRLNGQRRLGVKQYELSNHLGNVLSVVTDNIYLNATSTWSKAVSDTDYYPFGLSMSARSFQSEKYRYGFNGKEKDEEGMGGGIWRWDHLKLHEGSGLIKQARKILS